MIKYLVASFFVFAMVAPAVAQEAPAPRRMPRTPVSHQVLNDSTTPSSRDLSGPATVLDGEKIRVGKIDMRLFGIVPPQLAASYGPQARAYLDALIGGQSISCTIRDRDRSGSLLAICTNSGGNDIGLELLKRGLAVSARGSLSGTELANSYLAAEQSAQNQKIGLWSVVMSPETASQKADAKPLTAAETKKDEKTRQETQDKVAADVLAQQVKEQTDIVAWDEDETGFFERFQILIAGILILLTAISIMAAMRAQRSRDRKDELKALAAALRGELMAARSVCAGRARSITCDAEDHTATWPRIRITLYQAYVGRLGLLGSDLARQVASVYGQASDFAALYNPSASGSTLQDVSKKHALETLVKRIDDVLHKLAEIEKTGKTVYSPHVSHAAMGPTPPPQTQQSPRQSVPPAPRQRPVPQPQSIPVPPVEETPYASQQTAFQEPLMHPVHQVEEYPSQGFLSNLGYAFRQLIAPEPRPRRMPPPAPVDASIAEYTAIIEADMERYHYAENVDALDAANPSATGGRRRRS